MALSNERHRQAMANIFTNFNIVSEMGREPTEPPVFLTDDLEGRAKEREIWTDGYLTGARGRDDDNVETEGAASRITSAFEIEQRMAAAQEIASMAIAALMMDIVSTVVTDYTAGLATSVHRLAEQIKPVIAAGTDLVIRESGGRNLRLDSLPTLTRNLEHSQTVEVHWPHGKAVINRENLRDEIAGVMTVISTFCPAPALTEPQHE